MTPHFYHLPGPQCEGDCAAIAALRLPPRQALSGLARRYRWLSSRSDIDRDLQSQARNLLEVADHTKQIPGLRITARAKHADETLCRYSRRPAELLETRRRFDVVAQDRLAGIDIAAEHR